jgi:hypothetical protein
MRVADSGGVPRISTLVRRQIDAGVSAHALSRACGEAVAHQTFTALAKGEIKGWPKNTRTVEALAQVLGVDARAVVLGFAADLGLDVRESRSLLAAQLPAAAGRLEPEQVSVIRQLVLWLGEEPATARVDDGLRVAADTRPDAAGQPVIMHRRSRGRKSE